MLGGLPGRAVPWAMSNRYTTCIHPRVTGIWSQSQLSVHCVNLSHYTTIQFYIEFSSVPLHKFSFGHLGQLSPLSQAPVSHAHPICSLQPERPVAYPDLSR